MTCFRDLFAAVAFFTFLGVVVVGDLFDFVMFFAHRNLLLGIVGAECVPELVRATNLGVMRFSGSLAIPRYVLMLVSAHQVK